MRTCRGLWLLVIAGLCGCQSLEAPPQDDRASLVIAQTYLAEKNYAMALKALDLFTPDRMSLDDQSLWYLVIGTAHHQLGEHWTAFSKIRQFAIKQQFRRHSEQIANLLYDIGEALAQRDSNVMILWSDRQRAKSALTTLISYYPINSHLDDAQYRLGELAYKNGDFEEARLRFSKISLDSPWITKSLFRVAMCYFRNLEGPEYDLAEMERANNELAGFLASDIENPRYRQIANGALFRVQEMLAEKHRKISDYYFELDQPGGGFLYLQKLTDKYPKTSAGKSAKARLRTLRMAADPAQAAKN